MESFKIKVIKFILFNIFFYIYLDSKDKEKIISNIETNNNNKVFLDNSSRNQISNKILLNQEEPKNKPNIELLKPKSHSLDKKILINNKTIKMNIGNLDYILNNENKNRINKNIFLNTNRLPKIVQRLSLSNFHKNSNNKDSNDLKHDYDNNIKLNIFNKTFGF